ncbi:CorA family divalent cation transporter [Clostridium saccharobutylicum]|uniref:Mg2+ transporter protein, CorA family protein n=2 Tax=Clostridium saccharobutylicum TaxID=169679 RepID=U5MUJ7_CLOSA|nr:CorA family divalent cation transporter [Clostridium saccharobutylicum]AGX44208.1 Mg2+ transporter protein, CorA family protein [Clostridium saccharobutylicum DSM 13864]AQR91495.1 magnesium transport protein CorA [Clostridium saccharobutylicum]AQS01400.1 magnesium transport protein CorA [Clostridium saccharobutylicum]AQS11009.1 magnesium transport protein CorA [Clostridium saccharobutylicum]AQS15383.1 magnesium transport protein CorA [Clostridium saccharobutylicum]
MIYSLSNDALNEESIDNLNQDDNKLIVATIEFNELESIAKKLNINEKILYECLNGKSTKFESYEGFDYIAMKAPNIRDMSKPSRRMCIFFRKNLIVFIGDKSFITNDIINKIQSKEIKCTSLGKMLYLFFDKLTCEDTELIENVEKEIVELEESLITSKSDDYLNKIIILRKKLLRLKRYYERFLNIAENIEENENGLIDKKTGKYFRMFTNRINRLYQSVNNLRDYVTQVREAYQAQVDIDQNKLMKLFTVVTTIFLPLTLIVGWYGMNFTMPEYNLPYAYPVVIIISISIVVSCIVWFKKNKWF